MRVVGVQERLVLSRLVPIGASVASTMASGKVPWELRPI